MTADTRSTNDICFLTALELRDRIRTREISPVEATEAVLQQIERINPQVNAFVTLLAEQALDAARTAERKLVSDPQELGELHGIPIAVKDLTPTAGVRTTFGAPMFAEHIPDADALAWSRLKSAGCILIGKTTTPEFGARGVTESELTGITNNPWKLDRTAGGSSGGSAVAAATGMAHLTWGSDGGGSIRIPAAYCGVVGLKASIGRIPLAGEGESSFESAVAVGPITRTVADTALLTAVSSGPSIDEPYGLPAPDFDFLEVVRSPSVAGLRVAYCPDIGGARVAAEVRDIVDTAVTTFSHLGAEVAEIEMDLPDPIEHFLGYWAPSLALALDEGELSEYAPPPVIKALADVGRRASATDYARAIARRGDIAREFARVFTDHDLLVTPTSPVAAFPHPGDVGGNTEVDGVPVAWPMLDFHRMTEPFSHAGVPALTVPCGFTAEGLPVGMQIGASYRRDDLVLRAGAAFEEATDVHTRRPPLVREP